jgi:hypothetical protein
MNMYKRIPIQSGRSSKSSNPEINRLLTAAVINRNFRSMLLNDPAKAIAGGYYGEQFNIGSKAAHQVKSIHATSLADFAAQLAQ